MVLGIAAVALGLWCCGWVVRRPAAVAERQQEDRAMPWIGNHRLHGWTEKAIAMLPLGAERVLLFLLGLMIVAGGAVDIAG
jgi:uncharacterized membrane protein